MPSSDGAQKVKDALAMLFRAIQSDSKPEPLTSLPEFLTTEMQNLHDSLVYGRNHVVR
jgi:hypothetical protein